MSRKTVFKGIVAFILAALFLAMAGCGPDPFYIWVEFIEGVPESGTVGTPLALTATVRPVFASNKDIIWSVKDAGNTGADISGNILNAAAGGTVTIRAIITNGIAEGKEYVQDFNIVFTVPKVITDIAIKTQPAKLEYFEGETLNLSGIVVTLTYDDDSTEDVGLAGFTAKGITTSPAQGTALALAHNGQPVTVSAGGYSVNINKLTVSPVSVMGVTLDKTTLSLLTIGGTETLKATVTPSNATDKAVTWSTSNPAVATVSNGVVTAIAAGTATITVTTADGNKTATCAVVVLPEARIDSIGYATLTEAISAAAYGTESAPTEIIILRDITATSGYTIPANRNIKLNVEAGKNITITGAGSGLFMVERTNSSLTLGPITGGGTLTLSGNVAVNSTGVSVYAGRSFTMNDGVIITGFTYYSVLFQDATFIMNGGEIRFNSGINHSGGVNVGDDGTFIMNGGKISNNTKSGSGSGGGGVSVWGGTFTMNGGEISGNTASGGGGGVYVIYDGTFIMNGGKISDNTANGSNYDNGGGGVCVIDGGNFEMKGGYIMNNITANRGGGVFITSNNSVFTMSGGVIYGTDNTALTNIANGTAPKGMTLYNSVGTAQYGDGSTIVGTNNGIDTTITGHN